MAIASVAFAFNACKSAQATDNQEGYVMSFRGADKNVEKITRDMTPTAAFNKISLGGAARVTIRKGGFKVKITGEKPVVENLKAVVNDQMFSLDYSRVPQNTRGGLEIEISMPQIKEIDASGAALFYVTFDVNEAEFEVKASGASTVNCHNVKAPEIEFDLSGGAIINVETVDGREVEMDLSGGATANCESVVAVDCELQVSGGAVAGINALKASDLDVKCSGGATANCKSISVVNLDCSASGGATITVGGAAGKAGMSATGAARINASSLKCANIKRSTNGAGRIEE